MASSKTRVWLTAVGLGMTLGCGSEATTGGPLALADVTPSPVDPTSLSESDKAFQKQFSAVLEQAQTLDVAGLVAKFPSPATAAALPYDATKAEHLPEISSQLAMTAAETDKLAQNGFVVLSRKRPTPSAVYNDVYKGHLPLFITTDSLLHALHQSFDTVLKQLEVATLTNTVDALLKGTHAALATTQAPGELADAKADLDVYLAVARSLLGGSAVAPNDAALTPLVTALLAKVDGLQLETASLFGKDRVEDFSQFKPRGHYTESEALGRYFKAVMWLGRIDLRFREFDPDTGEPIYNDRQVRAAWLLRTALDAADARKHWQSADAIIGALMGEIDSLDFRGLDDFITAAGLDDAATVGGDLTAVHAILDTGNFGHQRISSHYLATNPFSSEVTPLPVAFTVLGQRYVIDSHVMSNVVYDRIVAPDGSKPARRLPSPLDAMFVLGQNHALTHLSGELTTYKYAGGLDAMRFLADAHGDEFWGNSVYNLWLSGLRGLSAPPAGAPAAMLSAAWGDKALVTTLASWAELRHDTILYAKQSYTGGASCDYPDAFVEPYPVVYARLGKAAQKLADVIATIPEADRAAMSIDVADWAARWVDATGKLESMANHQLAEEPISADEQLLVDGWIAEEPQGCTTSFTGIYPKLIADPEGITEVDPTIADVHTNPNEDGPLAPAAVLHVATGWTDTIVFTRETCEGIRAYVGPMTSYYEIEEPGVVRLNDEEWRDRIYQQEPPRPAWTTSFMAQ